MRRFLALALTLSLLLCGCAPQPRQAAPMCHLVLEEGTGFRAEHAACTVRQGEDAVFYLTPEDGYTFSDADYPDYSVEAMGNRQVLTLHDVRYSVSVTVRYAPCTQLLCYDGNGGCTEKGDRQVLLPSIATHLRSNTAQGTALFSREGHTLCGWNTAPDGSGLSVGLGSRMALEEEETVLYAMWAPWTAADYFTTAENSTGLTVTGCTFRGETLCVPASIGGRAVTCLAADAFSGSPCTTVILPECLLTVEEHAFRGAAVETLYLFDSLERLSGGAFSGCAALSTLHINAATPPRYSGTYFDAFQDKFDRLLLLSDRRKLVLFSGSSARFGYDSAALDEAFPDYEIVNMGVFAYTNALPQLLLILGCMGKGDVLLHAPEFDAAGHQFCSTTALDASLFAMMESNYDTLARLDLRQFSAVFSALSDYLSLRRDLSKKSYQLSAAALDEDGNPVLTPSYNEYGDYVVYRPNALTDEPVFDVRVSYTAAAFPKETRIAPLNAVYRRFLDRGVRVFFSYAPRNRLALTEDSTPQARQALDAYFRETLAVPVISELEESLYPGTYLYGTDNHLSTEGVAIRTQRVIADLRQALGS